MAKYAISPEGSAAMKSLAQSLLMSANGIIEASTSLFQKTSALSDGLGLYEEEILQIISKNKSVLVTNKDAIVSLATAAKQMSENIETLFPFSAEGSSDSGALSGSSNLPDGQDHISADTGRQMMEYSNQWERGLSDGQKKAIYEYTQEGPQHYRNINAVLRGKESSFEPGNLVRAQEIHAALSNASTPCDLTVYRGGGNAVLGALQNASDDSLVGQFFSDKGFVSTSMERSSAFFNDVLLEIHLPAGSHAANIESLSAAGKYEHEVLLDCGQIFRVERVYREDSGRKVVVVSAKGG